MTAAPAPETPAPDAMPEVVVGDVVVSGSSDNVWLVESAFDVDWCKSKSADVIAVYRAPIWRRQEAQP